MAHLVPVPSTEAWISDCGERPYQIDKPFSLIKVAAVLMIHLSVTIG
jgi:hypothetical protein